MEIVERLLVGEKASLFVTEEVFIFIQSFESKDRNDNTVNKAVKKLKYLADGGFINNSSIRPEGGGVFRIEIENTGRIIGFYDGKNFIGIKCFHKKSKKLTRMQRDIIKKVQEIQANKNWMYSINR